MTALRPLQTILCALAAALALAAPAAAQNPVTVGPGGFPRVAVDASGAGYVTWIQTDGNVSTFRYCKLPAGATACTAPFAFVDGNQDVDGGYALLTPDNRVLLVEARGVTPGRAKLLWTSGDGGVTFAGPTQIATLSATGGNISGGAVYAPAGALGLPTESIFTLGQIGGVTAAFQASGTTPGTSELLAELTPNVGTALALQGNTLIAALSDFSTLGWSRYAGPVPATYETLNAAANWTPTAPIGPLSGANTETRLVSGPAGIWVGYEVDSGAGQADFVVRRFDGSSAWSAPFTVAANAAKPDLHQDPSGRLHALWTDVTGLRYRYTEGTAWSAVQTIATGDSFGFPRLAVNAAGNGWAVWSGAAGVRAVPLRRVPSLYSGATTKVKTSGFGANYTLGVPRGCVQPGQRFRVTLSWKRQKRKGNLFVKVRRTDFYLGSRVLRKDTKVPFVHTYTVTVNQPRGSTITLRARAFIKVRRGREPKKSIRARVKVCA